MNVQIPYPLATPFIVGPEEHRERTTYEVVTEELCTAARIRTLIANFVVGLKALPDERLGQLNKDYSREEMIAHMEDLKPTLTESELYQEAEYLYGLGEL